MLSYVLNGYVLAIPCPFMGYRIYHRGVHSYHPRTEGLRGDMNDHRDMLQMYIMRPFDVVETHAMAAKLGSRYSEQFEGLHQFCS